MKTVDDYAVKTAKTEPVSQFTLLESKEPEGQSQTPKLGFPSELPLFPAQVKQLA
jgi:hypothetical protein